MGLKNNEISARSFKYYNYKEEMLNYIRALVPNDKKGKILGDSYKVSLKEFYEALQIMFHRQSFLEDLFEKVCSKNFLFSKVAPSS